MVVLCVFIDRREQGQWSPMMQRQYPNQPVPPYGPNMGMTPPGPPNMSHLSRNRMSPTPNRMREYAMSPSKQVCWNLTLDSPTFHCPVSVQLGRIQTLSSVQQTLIKHPIGHRKSIRYKRAMLLRAVSFFPSCWWLLSI